MSLRFLLVALGLGAVLAGRAEAASPRLFVLIVVDQMRADYVDRFGHQWTRGLRRLVDKGVRFRAAAYPYLDTVTCPGHATIGTGAFPSTHGMVLNAWYDRASGKVVPCTDDPTSPLVGHGFEATGGDSARNLLVPTFADELRAQRGPTSRVVALSMKARSVVTIAGRRAEGAVWFSGKGFVTSAMYSATALPWVNELLGRTPPALDPWTRKLPDAAYLYTDDAPEETPAAGAGRTFPHPLTTEKPGDLSLWETTPAADRHLGLLAKAALAAHGLGKGPGVDFLSVSFSSLDRIGHAFGPRSHEIQDVLARLDETLGDLFAELDRRVGKDAWLAVLTADHGVAPFPEQMAALGMDAGRIDMNGVASQLNDAITAALGPGKHVASAQYTNLYLAPGVRAKLAATPGAVKRVLDAVRSVPGVAAAFDADDLARGPDGADPKRDAAAISYHPARSGDILLVPRPHFLTVGQGTTHGTAADYDRRVPLFVLGARLAPAVHDRPVTPADIAPTFGVYAGVTLPRADGRPLVEVLPGRR